VTNDRREDGTPQVWSSAKERVIIMCVHWFVVLTVVVATAILAIHGTLDKLSVGTIYGTVIGHAGTSAAQKMSTRG